MTKNYKFLKSVAIVLIFFMGKISSAYSQVSLYDFVPSTTTYTAITGGTVVATATGTSGVTSLDDIIYNLPATTIPFNFSFNSTVYTGINISTNGFITFGATAPTATDYTPISSVTAFSGAAAAVAGNLNAYFFSGNSAQTGEIRYQTLGTSPNRIFVIQYKNFKTFATSGATFGPVMNFQIRLSETTNAITYAYSITGSFASATLQVGLRGANNTYPTNVKNRSVAVGTNTWATSINGVSNTSTCQLSSSSLPAAGLTYLFAPTTCYSPTDLNVSNVTTNGAILGWTNPLAGGTFSVEYGSQGFAVGSGISISTSNTTQAISGLIPQSNYSFYVTKICGGSSTSFTAGPFNFRTGALGEDCSTALNLNIASSLAACSYTTGNSGVSQNGPNSTCSDITGNQAKNDIWYKFVAPSGGNKLTITTQAGTINDWVMEVWTFCPGSGSVIKCGDDQNAFMPEIQLCQNEYTAGQTYYIRTWTYNPSATGTLGICIYQSTGCPLPPSNDICLSATRLNVNPPNACPANQQVFTTVNATVGTESATCDASTGKQDVWFVFNTGNFNDINLTITPLTATNLKAQFIFECGGFQINCYNPANGTYNLTSLNPQADYIVRVWTDAAGAGTFNICLSDVCSNPTATISGSQSICTTQSASIPVIFNGVPPYTFVYSNGTTNTTINTSNNPYNLVVTPAATTTYSLVSMSDGSCAGTVSGTHVVTVFNPQNATLNAFGAVCSNAGLQTLSGGSPAGGAYSGTGVSGTTFNPAAGTQTITYTVTYATGCTRSASQVFNVNPLPTVTLGSFASVCNSDPSFTLTGGSPAGGIYSGSGVAGGIFSPSAAGLGTKTITYTFTNANGCANTATSTIVVNFCGCSNPPTANAGTDKSSCGSSSVAITGTIGGAATSLVWSGGTGTYSPNTTTASINYTPSAAEITAGFAELIITANDPDGAGPCVAAKDTVRINISTAPTAGSISGTAAICGATNGLTYSVTNQAGVTYAWTVPANVTIVSGQGTNNISTNWASNAASGLVSCVVSNSCGSSTANFSVTFTNPSTVTLGAFTPVCINAGNQTLSGGSPAGGVYSGTGVSGTTFNPAVGTQTITYTVTFAAGCVRSASQVFTVNPLPTVTLGAFTAVCSTDAAFTLTGGSPAGGTYSGVGVSGGIFTPSVAGVGTKTITYTFTNGNGCTNTATSTIVVNSCGCSNPPTANAGTDKSSCGSSSVAITGTIGGAATSLVWSGGTGTYSPNTTTASINYTPSAAEITAGFAELIITANDPDGAGPCVAAKDTVRINISTAPTAGSISGTAAICGATNGLTYSVTNQAGVTYAWTVPANVTIVSGQGTNNISTNWASNAASGLVSCVVSNSCGSSTANFSVTFTNPSTVTLGAFTPVCINAGNQTLSGGSPAGGVYSGTGVSGTTFNPAVGTQTITYTVTFAAGCVRSASQVFTVNPLPTVTLGAFTAVCSTDAAFTLTGGSPAGGTYSGVGVSGGIFTPSVAGVGTQTITYTFTNGNGCTNTATSTIVVNSCGCSNPATASAGVDKSSCGNAAVSITGTRGGSATSSSWSGGNGTYSPNNTSLAITYTPSAAEIAAGTVTLTLTTNDPDGAGICTAASDAMVITILNGPAVGNITGSTGVCRNQTGVVYSVANQAGVTYTWTAPAGATITAGQGTNSITTSWSASAVSGTLSLSASNACGTSNLSFNIAVRTTAASQPGTITGSTSACRGDVYRYTIAKVANADFYVWTPPRNATINGSSLPLTTTDTAVVVTFSSTYTVDTLSVRGGNCVGQSTSIRTLRITQRTTVPATPAALSGQSTSLCGGPAVTYSFATTPSGAQSYVWRTTVAGALLNGVAGPVTITDLNNRSMTVTYPAGWVGTGNIYVKAVNGCGQGTERSLAVSATPGQPSVISGLATVCTGAINQVYSVSSVFGATTYTWTIPTGITIVSGQGTPTITVNFNNTAASRTIRVTANNACGLSASRSLTVVSAACPRIGDVRSAISNVQAYPNPVQDLLSVEFDSNSEEQFNLNVQDLSGRRILTQSVSSLVGTNKVELDLSGLSSGVYLLTVQSADQLSQLKIVVE